MGRIDSFVALGLLYGSELMRLREGTILVDPLQNDPETAARWCPCCRNPGKRLISPRTVEWNAVTDSFPGFYEQMSFGRKRTQRNNIIPVCHHVHDIKLSLIDKKHFYSLVKHRKRIFAQIQNL